MFQGKISAVFDLSTPVKNRLAEVLRQELAAKLEVYWAEKEKEYRYRFDHAGQEFRPIAGMVVHAEIDNDNLFSRRDYHWTLYDQLKPLSIVLSTSGTDHFPLAGIYHKPPRLNVHASVSYSLQREYPVDQDTLKHLVQAAYDDARYSSTARLVVPVVHTRKWSLVLYATTFKAAFEAYEELRSGKWPPSSSFMDALTDDQKVRLIEKAIDPIDDDDSDDNE